MKIGYRLGGYRGDTEVTATYSGELLLPEQVKDIPYSKQVAVLYKLGFTPENLTGEQDIIIMRNKDTKRCIVLYKGVGVFTFGGRVSFDDVKFIRFGNSVYGFQVCSHGKWNLYFRDDTSFQARESQSPCCVSQVRNGGTRDGSFGSFIEIHHVTILYFTFPVSNDVVDILENPRRY